MNPLPLYLARTRLSPSFMSRIRSASSARSSRAPWARIVAFVFLPLVLVLTSAGLFAAGRGIPVSTLFRDTTAVLNAPLYVGALSVLGLFLWAATAAVCFFTAALLWRHPVRSAERTFFLGAGLLTSVLLFDDAFLFHESIAPNDLGIPADVVFGAYGVAVIGLFWIHRHAVWDSAYSILGVGLAFLAAGVGVDWMNDYEFILPALTAEAPGLKYYLEDGAKLLGIAGWGAYFVWTGYERLTDDVRPASTAHADRGHEPQDHTSASIPTSPNGHPTRSRPDPS